MTKSFKSFKLLNLYFLIFISINSIVLPNANQIWLVIAMGLVSIGWIVRCRGFDVRVVCLISFPLAVTLLYVAIGLINGATLEAAKQAIFIYILSPLMWLMVIDTAFQYFSTKKIIFAISIFSIMSALSIPLYIWLYLNGGAAAVRFFGGHEANVNITQDYSGVTMHVLGSLIFLTAAFIARPSIVENKFLSTLIIVLLVFSVIVGGRTAAILAIFIGLFFYVIFNFEMTLMRLVIVIFFTLAFLFLVKWFINFLYGIDLTNLLSEHINKILESDFERPAQVAALLKGSYDNSFLGSGHGIGVEYTRSEEYPWRYEAVYFALIYKLGIVGFFLLMAPFFFVTWSFFKLLKKKIGDISFFMAGFVAAVVASFTNPYIEAFSFQWMYILPMYVILNKKLINKNELN